MKEFFKGNKERYKWILALILGTVLIQINNQWEVIPFCWEFFKSQVSNFSIAKYLG
jgi:hypothetical protein